MNTRRIPINRRQKVGTLKRLVSEYYEIEIKVLDPSGNEASDAVALATISSKPDWPKNFRLGSYDQHVGDFERYAKRSFGIAIQCVGLNGTQLDPQILIHKDAVRINCITRRLAAKYDTRNHKDPRMRTKCTLYDVIKTLEKCRRGPEDRTNDSGPWYADPAQAIGDGWDSDDWFTISKYLVLNHKPDEALFALMACATMLGTDAPSFWHQMARIAMEEGNRDRMGWAIENMENVRFVPYESDPIEGHECKYLEPRDVIAVATYCLRTLQEKEWARRILNHLLLDNMQFVASGTPCFDDLALAFLRLFGKEAITEARIAALIGFQWGDDWDDCANRLWKLKAGYICRAVERFEDKLGFPKRPEY